MRHALILEADGHSKSKVDAFMSTQSGRIADQVLCNADSKSRGMTHIAVADVAKNNGHGNNGDKKLSSVILFIRFAMTNLNGMEKPARPTFCRR